MPYSLVENLSYNLWANERIGHLLMAQDDGIIYAEHKSSFASIAKTVLHLWDAETIWFTRIQGNSLLDWPSKNFSGGKSEMLRGWINTSTELLQFVKAKGKGFALERVVYKNLKGNAFENTIEEILLHLINHGSYHRGQIITLLREGGINQLVSTDMIVWLRELKK